MQLAVQTSVAALKAVAEPTRLRLLVLLASGELNVKDLTRILGQSQPRISRHLKLLAEAGLVERAPEGSWVYFRLAEAGRRRRAGPARAGGHRSHRSRAGARPASRRGPAAGAARAAAQAYFAGARRSSGTASARCTWPRRTWRRPWRRRWDLALSICSSISAPARAACSSCSATRYRRGLGIDLSPAMLAYARAKLEARGTAARPGAAGRHLRSAAGRPVGGRGRHAPGAALPERPSARRARGRPRAGAGRTPADRRLRPARAGVPARAVRARAARVCGHAGASSGWPTAA